jgi:hypothetical protein
VSIAVEPEIHEATNFASAMARLPASATMITSVEPLAMMRPKDSLGSAVEPRREIHRSERERLAGARTAGVSRAVSCRLVQTRTRSQRLARGMNGVTMRDRSTDGRLFTDRFHMKLPAGLGRALGELASIQCTTRSEIVRQAMLRAVTEAGLSVRDREEAARS